MNLTNLCLNVDIIVKAPILDKNKDIDFGWFLLEIITFISIITSIIWRGIFIEKESLGILYINSQSFFF